MDISDSIINGVSFYPTSSPPAAPTIGTVTVVSDIAVTVGYTAPADNGGEPITKYTAVSVPGNITGTVSQSGSGTITVTGLTGGTNYVFYVYATNAVGDGEKSSNSASIGTLITGQIEYTTPGTYYWVCPDSVFSISAVCIGGGGGGGGGGYLGSTTSGQAGGGGALSYINNYSVTPGGTYTIVVGNGGPAGASGSYNSTTGGDSYISYLGTNFILAAGHNSASSMSFASTKYYKGGNGGSGNSNGSPGGGGAAGYGTSGLGLGYDIGGAGGGGFSGGTTGAAGVANTGSAGGGSGQILSQNIVAYGGGGVGIYGIGSTGGSSTANGNPGSGGTAGTYTAAGIYGGGGQGGSQSGSAGVPGGKGAVRIIYPGVSRSFPSTRTTDL